MGDRIQTIAVDCDGVLHAYSRGWADGTMYDGPLPGAVEGLRALQARYAVFVFTSRDPEQVVTWLEALGVAATTDDRCETCHGEGGGQELDYDYRPVGPAWDCTACDGSGLLAFWNSQEQVLVTQRKLPAIAYVDDRSLRFTNWPQTLAELGVDGGQPATQPIDLQSDVGVKGPPIVISAELAATFDNVVAQFVRRTEKLLLESLARGLPTDRSPNPLAALLATEEATLPQTLQVNLLKTRLPYSAEEAAELTGNTVEAVREAYGDRVWVDMAVGGPVAMGRIDPVPVRPVLDIIDAPISANEIFAISARGSAARLVLGEAEVDG